MKIVSFDTPNKFVYVQCAFCGETYSLGLFANNLLLTFCTEDDARRFGLTMKEVRHQWSICRELTKEFLIDQALRQLAEIDAKKVASVNGKLSEEEFSVLSEQQAMLTRFLFSVRPGSYLFWTIDYTGKPAYELREPAYFPEEEVE